MQLYQKIIDHLGIKAVRNASPSHRKVVHGSRFACSKSHQARQFPILFPKLACTSQSVCAYDIEVAPVIDRGKNGGTYSVLKLCHCRFGRAGHSHLVHMTADKIHAAIIISIGKECIKQVEMGSDKQWEFRRFSVTSASSVSSFCSWHLHIAHSGMSQHVFF